MGRRRRGISTLDYEARLHLIDKQTTLAPAELIERMRSPGLSLLVQILPVFGDLRRFGRVTKFDQVADDADGFIADGVGLGSFLGFLLLFLRLV